MKQIKLKKRDIAAMLIPLFESNPNERFDIKTIWSRLNLTSHPARVNCIDALREMVADEYLIEPERMKFRLMRKRGSARPAARRLDDRRMRDGHQIRGDRRIGGYRKQSERPEIHYCGDNDTDMHAILEAYGLPYSYPYEVERAAEEIPDEIPAWEIQAREDMRDAVTFTIDPRDAKDFDDALSIMPIDAQWWQVGVHIADVSHYVPEGSIIDREARRRATSVYLVDRTIPMLPERLCNKICSLRPDEDKLTYSVVFEINEQAEVRAWHLAHTVTRSNRRFTYEEVQAVLEAHGEASPEDIGKPGDKAPLGGTGGGASPLPAELFAPQLITLNRMAKQLRARRFEHGAVAFERPEARFEIDEKGKPISVYFKVAKDANKLIEEFMLLANRTVAESIGKKEKGLRTKDKGAGKVLPYRIHDKPDEQKLMNLTDIAARFGHHINTTSKKLGETNRQLNRLMADIEGRPESNMLQLLTLKAMAKARYSTVNIGHYGLAFEYYTHFTSPIRRYPDLMVHRLLTRYAEGGKSASKQKYEDLCEHSSQMEQNAAMAERDSIKYKQVEFMADRIGQEYEGMVCSLTDWGMYVELDENHCEGMIPIHNIDGDYYVFDEKTFTIIGRRTHHRFTLGDRLRVKVAHANMAKRQLNFEFIEKLGIKN